MQTHFTGRVWLLGNDIDTDIIIPTEYLALPTVADMAPYAFSPLRPQLAAQIRPGDIIVAGSNFGCGSSREQAPEVLKALGLSCIIAKSFARIFFRNAVNNGLLLLESPTLPNVVAEGDEIEVTLGESVVHAGTRHPLAPIAQNVLDILEAGGLVPMARRQSQEMQRQAALLAEAEKAPVIATTTFEVPDPPDKPDTAIEKIFRRNTGIPVRPGQMVMLRPQRLMIHDIFVPFVADKFRQMGFPKIWDPDAVVLIYDHLVPAATADDVRHFKAGDAFVEEYGLHHVHRSDGICHQLMVEAGYVKPGDVVFGTDSHTTTYGAVGAFSTGIGYTEMAATLGTGMLWARVPQSIRVVVEGTFPANVSAKDLILRILGDIGADGAVYQCLEFSGSAVSAMSLSDRMTIANMAVEAGAKCAVFPADEKSLAFCGPAAFPLEDLAPDPGAEYTQTLHYQADTLQPVMACPSQVDNIKPVSALAGTPVDQVFIGSCTNGRLEDLRVAADVLRGKKISPFTRLVVTPASRQVYTQAAQEGLLAALVDAGATVTLPGCGLCCGRAGGILANGEVVVATNNRNFMGRMGDASVQIYLSGPLAAAHAALNGNITLI